MKRVSFLVAASLVITHTVATAEEPLPFDRGANGVWHDLVKLSTTGSVLHITAHPDDEHGGVLTRLSRGDGTRVALLSLTRGEAGANAIGPELFDGLGWIRAEELHLAGRYYGLDALYFTRLADYGYSKRLDEAIDKWGRETALRDMVYVIRMERPLVVISRFQGTERDGHGQHQFAGVMSQEAFRAAGDPERFPEQLEHGLEPWQPLKLYLGGYREDEDWTIAVDSGVYSPWLGDTFENVARKGLSLQRSQTSGRLRPVEGSFTRYYKRVESLVEAPEKEASFFDGIDVAVENPALAAFDPNHPERVLPSLVKELSAAATDRRRRLVEDAIHAILAVDLTADAAPSSTSSKPSSPFAPRPTLAPVVPGGRFEVQVSFQHQSPVERRVTVTTTRLRAPSGWRIVDRGGGFYDVTVAPDAAPWTPHITRDSIAESRYEGHEWYRGAPAPTMEAVVEYEVDGATLAVRTPVTRWEAELPYGYVRRELVVLPAASVRVKPNVVVGREELDLVVEVESHTEDGVSGEVMLELPDGFESEPERHRVGAVTGSSRYRFRLSVPSTATGRVPVAAVLRTQNDIHRSTYTPIEHRDLEMRYRVTPAEATVLPLSVKLPEDLKVGYVMGVGDDVLVAIAELGADVELLDSETLARGELVDYDAIVVGTRAYAVREDLRAHNARLLDYVEEGGNLVVLYNTPEFQPNAFAPHPGELPRRSEEISEEDAPVRILAADEQVLRWPNPISLEDFDGWVEQRGSKFWSSWDEAYVPLVESHDVGQPPQRGGWLQARYGEGTYTYFAYALHRQLPYGVPGAYKLLANLLSLGSR